MSVHYCEKCGLAGEVKFEQGERKAHLATCAKEDCPQRPPDWIRNLFAVVTDRNDTP